MNPSWEMSEEAMELIPSTFFTYEVVDAKKERAARLALMENFTAPSNYEIPLEVPTCSLGSEFITPTTELVLRKNSHQVRDATLCFISALDYQCNTHPNP